MSDRELLELPAPFEGLPYGRRLLAFDSAEAMLPANLVTLLGAATAELVLVNAAAHWLVLNGDGDPHTAGFDPMPPRQRPGSPSNTGAWSGSPYGDVVAGVLTRLPRASGRGRSVPRAV